jgi:HEPN domain-containing protein
VARKIARGKEPHHDEACFHAQQASEKYLKALLEELSQPIPRTHVLEDLAALLLPYHSEVRPLRRGGRFLTRFAVRTPYPGEDATKRQTEAALRWAGRIRAAARSLLNIKPSRTVRKKPP